jgi:hypothetical protein
VRFHLKEGVRSVSWEWSCKNCTDDAWLAYALFETEQFKQMEAANIYDADESNDKPIFIECQNVYAELSPDSTRVVALDASRRYTVAVFNFNEEAVAVSGEMAMFWRFE